MSRNYSISGPLFVFVALAVALVITRHPGNPPTLAYASFGSGPTVVFVHGLGSRPGHWLRVARWTAEHHQVVLVDLPGHGASPMARSLTVRSAGWALANALEHVSNDPVILVGHSIGGLVAAEAALQNPGRVRGLVLVETALRPQVDDEERMGIEDAMDRDFDGFVRAIYRSFGHDSAQGAMLAADAADMDAGVMRTWIDLALQADISKDMDRLQVPVLAVLSDRSWPGDEPWDVTARALGYEQLHDLKPVRIENAGHFVMLDDPSTVARAIERFAARFDQGSLAAR